MTHEIVIGAICFIAAALFLNGIISAAVFAAAVAFPAAFYCGREHAQAEYRYIQSHGKKRELCPWWCGFLPEAWDAKSVLDLAGPCAVSAVAYMVFLYWK